MSDDPDPVPPALSELELAPGYRLGLVLDPDGTVRSISEAVGIGNFVPEVFVGRHIADASATGARGESRRAVWVERVAEAHRRPEPAIYDDLRPDALDGALPVTTVTVTPIAAADGTMQAILVAIHDRSAADEIARMAREQGELLRSALDVTGMGSFALYLRERRFDSDERYREIFGYDPAPQVAERGFSAFIDPLHDDDRERVSATFREAVRGREGVNYQQEYRIWVPRPAGPELRRITVLARVEVDEYGPRRLLGVVDDVTDRRREDELRIRMQKREALGTLAGGMAHDFNNVISAILSNASVASAELRAGADPSTSIDEIARGARRAGDLVRRMLDFSRDREPERRAYSLPEVVRDACGLLRPTLPAGVDVSITAPADLPQLLGDPSQLHQVVMNLVTNAGQAMTGRTGAIEVTVDEFTLDEDGSGRHATLPPGDYLRLQVHDDGRGIPEEDLGRIFDPFFTTKSRGEGTGLGLAAAQSIVRSHRGLITADSLVDSGTVVTVLLPLEDAADPGRGAASPVARAEAATPAAPAGNPRVLFVDDEPALVTLAERALPHHGCDVTAFTEPTDALAALKAEPDAFDALVTDLAMPVLTGFELIAAVREVRPDLPVVLTSGFLTDESHAEARRLAVDRVVPKPCAIDQLAAAVHAYTRPR